MNGERFLSVDTSRDECRLVIIVGWICGALDCETLMWLGALLLTFQTLIGGLPPRREGAPTLAGPFHAGRPNNNLTTRMYLLCLLAGSPRLAMAA